MFVQPSNLNDWYVWLNELFIKLWSDAISEEMWYEWSNFQGGNTKPLEVNWHSMHVPTASFPWQNNRPRTRRWSVYPPTHSSTISFTMFLCLCMHVYGCSSVMSHSTIMCTLITQLMLQNRYVVPQASYLQSWLYHFNQGVPVAPGYRPHFTIRRFWGRVLMVPWRYLDVPSVYHYSVIKGYGVWCPVYGTLHASKKSRVMILVAGFSPYHLMDSIMKDCLYMLIRR